ncbi:MAG: hypothetical protein V3V22_07190 [Methylococcales bacterium]
MGLPQQLKKTRQLLLTSMLLGLCLIKPLYAEWDEWLVDTDVSFSAEDNINRSIYDNESKSDQFWSGFVSLGRLYHFSGFTRMDISAQLDGRIHHKYSGLNQLTPGLRLGIRHKLGLGPYQPWVRGYVSSGHIFSRSKIRQGFLTHAGISLGKPLHERIDVEFGYRFDHRESQDSNAIPGQRLVQAGLNPEISNSVYDLTGHSAELQFNAVLTEQILLNLGYAFRSGDIVSTNMTSLAPRLTGIIDAIAMDDAFPGDWAYRADGISHTYSVNASYAFMDGHASINLGYQHTGAHAKSFTYRTNSYRINFMYNF